MSHEVISDAGLWGDPTCESSELKVLTRAGQAERAGRSIKQTLQLREDTPLDLDGRGHRGCRAPWSSAKTALAGKRSLSAPAGTTGVLMMARRKGLAE